MNAESGLLSGEGTHELGAGFALLFFAELLMHFDVESARAGERFDRLQATHGRAGQDTRDLVVVEEFCEPRSLAPAPSVERPRQVIAHPVVAVAGRCMADEQERHRRLSSERRTAQSREYVRRSEACSGVNHSISSTSPFGSKLPELGSSSQ